MDKSHPQKRNASASVASASKRSKNAKQPGPNDVPIKIESDTESIASDVSSSSEESSSSNESTSSNLSSYLNERSSAFATIRRMDNVSMKAELRRMDNNQFINVVDAVDSMKNAAQAEFVVRLQQGKIRPEIDMNVYNEIVRHFGRLFIRLKVNCSADENSSCGNECAIVDNCVALESIVFDSPKSKLLYSIESKFPTVLDVTIVNGMLTDSSEHMPKWFPQLQRLTLHNLTISDAQFFECRFPHLVELTLVDLVFDARKITDAKAVLLKMLKNNWGLRKLVLRNVQAVQLGHKTIKYISFLPCLESLRMTINHDDFQANAVPEILFKVKRMEIEVAGDQPILGLPFTFIDLEKLHLTRVNVEDVEHVGAIVANIRLNELVLIDCELDLPGLMRIAKNLPLLKNFTMRLGQCDPFSTSAELANFLFDCSAISVVRFIGVTDNFQKNLSICLAVYDLKRIWKINAYADVIEFTAIAAGGTA